MDGFFTLLVATATQFAVVRDSFACKPAVVAETDAYAAVASEYQALAELPGIGDAHVFEPCPRRSSYGRYECRAQLRGPDHPADQRRLAGSSRRRQRADDRAAGRHNLAVGLVNRIGIAIEGNAGYFIGGLGDGPDIIVDGFVGWSVGENLMSGSIRVRGNVSECAGASSHGGTIIIEGDASSRAGISLKGGTVIVAGRRRAT